jgi:ubiquinone/menaquinone biosynthesis C-methylase UbiE
MKNTRNQSTLLPPSPFVRDFVEQLDYGSLRVLDVGCSAGRNAAFFAEQGHQVTGIDVVATELLTIRQNEGLQLAVADAKNLPFKDEQFDIVTCNEMLHLLPGGDIKMTLRGIQKVTRKGGFNVISGYIGDHVDALGNMELYDMYSLARWHIISYTEDHESRMHYGSRVALTSLAKLIAVRC